MDLGDVAAVGGTVLGGLGLVGGVVSWWSARDAKIRAEATVAGAASAQAQAQAAQSQMADSTLSQRLDAIEGLCGRVADAQAAQATALSDMRGEVRESVAALRGDVQALRAEVSAQADRARRQSDRVAAVESRAEQGDRDLWTAVDDLRRRGPQG